MTVFTRFALLLSIVLTVSGCGTVDRLLPSHGEGKKGHGSAKVRIDLSSQRAFLYRRGEVLAASRISTGRDGFETPTGSFKIVQKDQDHRSTIYGDYIDAHGRVLMAGVDIRKDRKPPGADFRGASMPYFLRFNGPIGLHAGNVRWYPASHGCVRLPLGMARTFFLNTKVGTPVVVTD